MKNLLNVTKPSPKMVFDGLKIVVDAYKENQSTIERERTKRLAIDNASKIELEKIKSQRKVLETYFSGIFEERRYVIGEMFDRLDKSIDENNLEAMQMMLGSIVDYAKESPLNGVQALLNDFNDPNVKEIEF